MRVELELAAHHAARRVDLIDRELRAVHHGDTGRSISTRRTGDQADQNRLLIGKRRTRRGECRKHGDDCS